MTQTLNEELNLMRQGAEQLKSDAHADVALAIGDNLRQGDLYVVRVDQMPDGKPRTNRQLAIGSTQGSRHILDGKVKSLIDPDFAGAARSLTRLDRRIELRPYQIGPAFEVSRGKAVTITHPEHGDRTLTEPGCYQVVYQRALDADEQEMREQD
jgi:hypothetical protein